MIHEVYDNNDSKASEKHDSKDDTEEDEIHEIDEPAYVVGVGTSLNISCLSPDDNFWCSSTSSFDRSLVWLDQSSCFTTINDTTSSSVQVVYHSGPEELSKSINLEDEFSNRKDWVASTLILKNVSIHNVGAYECFTFYSKDKETENNLETIYQTLYLYVDGDFDRISVPIDHLYKKKQSEDVFEVSGKTGTNVILPCRPTHPDDITVHLFKQEPKTREKIVDVINDINSKVSSSQFYQHNVTSLFYYHPRIGFVLDNVSDDDEGIYHCQFTSAYKLEELISFKVMLEHQVEENFVNLTGFGGNLPTDRTNSISLGVSSFVLQHCYYPNMCLAMLFLYFITFFPY